MSWYVVLVVGFCGWFLLLKVVVGGVFVLLGLELVLESVNKFIIC